MPKKRYVGTLKICLMHRNMDSLYGDKALNLLYCTSMGWLEEISFRDKPTIAINCITIFMLCIFISAIKSIIKREVMYYYSSSVY
jgi:hypothetical protein